MDGAADLLALLPEVQEALSDDFDGIECSISPGPMLTQAPFGQSFKYLGRQITFVPDLSVSCLEDVSDSSDWHRINLSKNSAVFTDGQSSCCLELALGRGKDWHTPLARLFDRLYSNKWAFFIAELEHSHPTFHVLSHGQPMVSSMPKREDTPDSTDPSSQISSPSDSASESASNFSLWIVPVTRIFAIPPPKKVKVVKKIVKKKSPPGENGTTTTEDGKEKKVRVVRKVVKKEKESPEPTDAVPTNNSSRSSVTTLVASPSSSNTQLAVDKDFGTPPLNPPAPPQPPTPSSQVNIDTVLRINGINGTSHTTQSPSTALTNGSPMTNGIPASTSTSQAEDNEPPVTDDAEDENELRLLRLRLQAARERRESPAFGNGLRPSLSRKSITPDRRLDPILESAGKKLRSISPSKSQEVVCRINVQPPPTPAAASTSSKEPPFLAMSLVLGRCFNYEQLGRLREVHPHWDEMAGQLLNSGYYKLLDRSDQLLMQLQRKLPSDPSLHYPTTVLTNIQVHILNPVDIMRAVLDEGVCCFPYGRILDKCFMLLDQIEFMLAGGDQPKVDWESVSLLAKKAQLHYRTKLEKTMEDRLGENLRLKAAQRIIRLDSFMVESTVTKLEKEQQRARDDLKWEIEQLQQQNSQLRKDNRELKQNQMKLEARVEILEQKFKMLSRLFS